MKNKTIFRNFFKSFSVFVFLLIIWGLISKYKLFSSFVFPGPLRVWNAFISMCKSGELYLHSINSFIRVLEGFTISFLLAFIFSVIKAICKKFGHWFTLLFEFLRHVPPMSLIPLLILWFGIGETPKIIVIILTSFFPMYMNMESGIENCDKKLIEVGEILKMNKKEIFVKIKLPSAVPQILTGMQIGLGYSWRAIVGAEMIAASRGLGYMILDSQTLSRTDKVMVGIILIGLMGLLMDLFFSFLINSIDWQRKTNNE
jgi:sulfonate transport system permease protein